VYCTITFASAMADSDSDPEVETKTDDALRALYITTNDNRHGSNYNSSRYARGNASSRINTSGSEDNTNENVSENTNRNIAGTADSVKSSRSLSFSKSRQMCTHLSVVHDAGIDIWDTYTGKHHQTVPNSGEGRFQLCCFSTADKGLSAAATSNYEIVAWTVNPFTELWKVVGHSNAITSICFNNDSSVLLSASRDGTFTLWDASTGERIGGVKTRNEDRPLLGAYWAQNLIISANFYEGTLKLWGPSDGSYIGSMVADRARASFSHFAISPSGEFACTVDTHFGGAIGDLIIWNVPMRSVHKIEESDNLPISISFTPDSSKLIGIAAGELGMALWLWWLKDGVSAQVVDLSCRLRCVTHHPTANLLIAGCDRNKIHYFNASDLRELECGVDVPQGLLGGLHSISLSPLPSSVV
jgi:WD40 repeat protein